MSRLKITVLGCGDSAGVPRIGGDWGKCDPHNPKNRRTRPSIMVQSDITTIVVDTGPDFGLQLTRENIKTIDGVLYTHDHSDHVSGIDDLRVIRGRMDKNMPVFMDDRTFTGLSRRVNYMFHQTSQFYPVTLDVNLLTEESFGQVHKIGDIEFIPFEQDHGHGNFSLGYRFGDFGYSTDMTNLDNKAIETLKGIKTWIADCADFGHGHGSLHADLPTVERLNAKIGAEKVYLTHLKMFYDYNEMARGLPNGYEPCYDGLTLPAE